MSVIDKNECLKYLNETDFGSNLNKLCEQLKDKKVVIYGVGAFFETINAHFDLSKLNILAVLDKKFIDSNEKSFLNFSVYPPDKISELDFDYILIGAKYTQRIIQDLVNTYSISAEHIIPLIQLKAINDEFKPRKIRLEASTICQLKCKCCYMGRPETTVGINYLKYKDFVDFVEKNDFVEEIELSNSGEIFLNPDLLKIIEFAHTKKIKLTAYNGVNFNTVSDEVIEGLVKYNFFGLTFSIDGASQESYVQYRVGGSFDKVIENIRKLNYYKNKYSSEYPILNYKFIIFGHNEKEIPKAKTLAKELNMNIMFSLNWDKTFSPVYDKNFIKKETGLDCVVQKDYVEKNRIPYYFDVCDQLWNNPQINWDGALLGCCSVITPVLEANAFELGLSDALRTEKISYMKQMLMNKAKERSDIPCSGCSVYKEMKKYGTWITQENIQSMLS